MSTKRNIKPSGETSDNEEVAKPETIDLETFLSRVDAPATLKAMFKHYTIKAEGAGIETTPEAFGDLFDAFRRLPQDKLK